MPYSYDLWQRKDSDESGCPQGASSSTTTRATITMIFRKGPTIPLPESFYMYKDLKMLFGDETPSVRLFKAKLCKLSEEEQTFYHKAALEAAFFDWESLPPRYRDFITRLFSHQKQKTLDYLLRSTVMGSLRFDPIDPELLQQVFSLVEGKQENGYEPSYPELAFAFLLAFKVDYSVKYFTRLLRENKLLEDDFWYLLERVKHGNEPGRQHGDGDVK